MKMPPVSRRKNTTLLAPGAHGFARTAGFGFAGKPPATSFHIVAKPRQTNRRHTLGLLPEKLQRPPDAIKRVPPGNPTDVAFVNRLS